MDLNCKCTHKSCNSNSLDIITRQDLNIRRRFGFNDKIKKKLYTSLDASSTDIPLQKFSGKHGAIFNLEFSEDGRLVVAACEEKAVLLFDSLNQKKIQCLEEAHTSCVNNIRFLTDHSFVTCSDDPIIKIWDLRKLTAPTRILLGDSHWVKNVEYIKASNHLITSALDGNICIWDLRNPSVQDIYHENVILVQGITRFGLTPDNEKMIICTSGGYFIIVHNLDIKRLFSEMETFKPNVYRLMQTSGQVFPCATMYNYFFSQTRKYNRLEIVDDLPKDAELITSLQIHPMGWSSLTRSINNTETKEWTAVHDIQTRDPKEYNTAYQYVEELVDLQEDEADNLPGPKDIWIRSHSFEDLRAGVRHVHHQHIGSFIRSINSGLIGVNDYDRILRHFPEDRNRIVMPIRRLTHSISERMVAEGVIKEMSFSNDGRIICSPYGTGVRLLAFNEKVQELPYCVTDEPQELCPIAVLDNYHTNYVFSSKFNPVHCQLVTGCAGGEIVWYKPFL